MPAGNADQIIENQVVPLALAKLNQETRPKIKHQCGSRHLQNCRKNYKDVDVEAEVIDFIEDMASVYAWADLVVCRAGALTIAELTAVGIGSILIPYPYAVDNHQYHNARFLAENDAARIITEDALNAEALTEMISGFQRDRQALIRMAVNAHSLAKANATEQLAKGILMRVRS